ncbi:MAG: 30S ribosomal protein S9 [Anaerolineales bacterium]|nr:30S ribosomal protein S9 [Anaerolineales bacterium]
MAELYYEGVGRRKTSTARVRVTKGSGEFVVNGKPMTEYFPRLGDKEDVLGPLEDSGNVSTFDVSVKVIGGGVTGQAGAVRMGLARALLKFDPELAKILHDKKHLTRDPRVKERKKPGLKRARKAPTYTKR